METGSFSPAAIPAFDLAPLGGIVIERPVPAISDAEIEAEIATIAAGLRTYSVLDRQTAARAGDRVTVTCRGALDSVVGEPRTVQVVLGAGGFIPSIEVRLFGARVGDAFALTIPIVADPLGPAPPASEARYAVEVLEVASPDPLKIDNKLARALGAKSLAALTDAVRAEIRRRHEPVCRRIAVARLLDALGRLYDFEPPAELLRREFDAVRSRAGETATPAECEHIAARTVRLGLVLWRAGEEAGIVVEEHEVQRAMTERAHMFPGHEQRVVEFYSTRPAALASLKAPIYEAKVVDHLLATVRTREVPTPTGELAEVPLVA